MISIDHDIDMLVMKWRSSNIREDVITARSNDLRNRCHDFIQENIQAAYSQALHLGFEGNSEEFLDQLKIIDAGLDSEITTASGQTDFSTASYPMLPGLLKNAKVAKDGTLYKQIPLTKKESSTVETIRNMNADKWEMKRELQKRKEANKIKTRGGKTEFRTVTSKTDPATSWIHPGIKKDFTEALDSINTELRMTLVLGVRQILEQYEESLWR